MCFGVWCPSELWYKPPEKGPVAASMRGFWLTAAVGRWVMGWYLLCALVGRGGAAIVQTGRRPSTDS